MTSGGPHSLASWIAGVSISLLTAFLGWSIVTSALSQLLAPEAAIQFAPTSPTTLARLAEAEYFKGHKADAARLARASLTRAPFTARAVRVLGMSLNQDAQPELTDQLMTLAGNWDLADSTTHLWLSDRRMQQGEYSSAFAHLHMVLRWRQDLWPALFDAMAADAQTNPRVLEALCDQLAQGPNWRAPFLEHLENTSPGQDLAASIADRLKRDGHELGDDEISRLFGAMMRERRFDAVIRLADSLKVASRGDLVDGGFEDEAGPLPFQWRIAGGAGATVEIVSDHGPSKTLHIAYDGYSTPDLVSQILRLAGGAYQLTGTVSALGAAERLTWEVRCVQDGKTLATERRSQPPTAEGHGFAIDFTVPAEGCVLQVLELTPQPGERYSDVSLWYDDLRIRPTTP